MPSPFVDVSDDPIERKEKEIQKRLPPEGEGAISYVSVAQSARIGTVPLVKKENQEPNAKVRTDMCGHCTTGFRPVNAEIQYHSLMHPVASFLKAHGVQLNRDLGQHFLIDDDVLAAIVDAAHIEAGDHIMEIGAGIGVLTKELTERAKNVTAIEVDANMIPLLKEFTGAPANLNIIQGNALHVPFPSEPYKIVANIPYHITSPLLRHAFLESAAAPRTLTLLIQREVAEKICETEDRGLLTILVGLFGTPRIIRTVPPSAFLPPPAVDSAVLHIDCFDRPRAEPEILEEIFTLTKLAFGQKRKMVRNTLGQIQGGMERLKAASIEPERRPQTLSVDEWIELARTR
jgi:16S rRNA (adenine1518-N6/adenine1519-N6)-dimethyltransferase